MRKNTSARNQAARIEWMLEKARRSGGTLTYDAAAQDLSIPLTTVKKDLRVLVARDAYTTASSGSTERISLDGTRLRIENPRPRSISGGDLSRLAPLDPVDAEFVEGSGAGELLIPRRSDDEVRSILEEAIRDQRPVWVDLLKAGESEPEARLFNPLCLFQAEAATYLAAQDPDEPWVTWKTPRMDRIVSVRLDEGHFKFPRDFKLAHVVNDQGRLVTREPDSGPGYDCIVIRYASEVAPWVEERRPGGTMDGEGRYTVVYDALAEGWAVEEVMHHAPHAELLEPAKLRTRVRQTALGIAGSEGKPR